MTATARERSILRALTLHPPRRVLFFDHYTELSGGERSLLDILLHVDRTRIDPALLVPDEGPLSRAARAAGIPVHVLEMSPILRRAPRWGGLGGLLRPERIRGTLDAARSLARLMRDGSYRILHTNSLKAHVIGSLARARGRFRLVWHLRDILEPSALAWVLGALGGTLPDRILTISLAVAESLPLGRIPSVRRRLEVLHNGVPAPSEIRSERFRASLKRIPTGRLVGMVGQIARWKGQDVFLRAAARVAAVHPDVGFPVVGEVMFPENEEAYRESLDRVVEELDLAGRVAFTGFHDRPDEAMAAMEMVVHASVQPEPFGRVLIEAMSLGRPVIATSHGGPLEILRHRETGLLVPPSDPEALAGAMLELLDQPELARRLGEAGRNDYRDRFTMDRIVERLMTIYDEVDGGSTP